MTKRAKLMSFATFTALCFLSGASRADSDVINLADNDGASGHRSTTEPLSCSEATKGAWFYRQLELTDGDTSPDVQVPAECQRERFAQHDDAK